LEVLNTVVVKNCTTTKACHGASKQTSLTTVCASANRNLATLFFLFPKSSTILFGSPILIGISDNSGCTQFVVVENCTTTKTYHGMQFYCTLKIPRVQNRKLRQERSLSVQKNFLRLMDNAP